VGDNSGPNFKYSTAKPQIFTSELEGRRKVKLQKQKKISKSREETHGVWPNLKLHWGEREE